MNKLLCLSVVVVCASAVPALGRQDAKVGPKPVYRTEPVKRGSLEAVVRASGLLQPEETALVGALVTGRVEKFGPDPKDATKSVDYGTAVEAGTLLLQLDP